MDTHALSAGVVNQLMRLWYMCTRLAAQVMLYTLNDMRAQVLCYRKECLSLSSDLPCVSLPWLALNEVSSHSMCLCSPIVHCASHY